MAMESVAVSSSAISYLAYDEDTGEAQVTFKDGKSYTLTIPQIEFSRWSQAESVGGYWNSFIKGNY